MMWDDVKAAAREGVVWGVKLGLAAVILLVAVSWLLGDYAVVRQRAANGDRAFQFIQQQIAAAQKAPSPLAQGRSDAPKEQGAKPIGP